MCLGFFLFVLDSIKSETRKNSRTDNLGGMLRRSLNAKIVSNTEMIADLWRCAVYGEVLLWMNF